MDEVQGRVQALIDDLVARDVERGLQVAAYYKGQLIVDAWAGVADPATGRVVDGDTLFTVWSAGKGIAATVLHQQVERGRLRYDTPVAEVWPEFATHGKAEITVAHVLTHTSGIPQIPDGVSPAELLDWDTMCRRVADLTPLWTPGTATGYHAMNYGWLVGEVVRRVDGRSFATIVREDICAPLGISSLFFGIPDAVEGRVATLEEPAVATPPPPPPPDVLAVNVAPPWRAPSSLWANGGAVRRAVLPSSGAIANARSLARHYAGLVGAGVDGVRLLSPERVAEAAALRVEGVDLIFGAPIVRALGYHLGQPYSPMSERTDVFGHAGAGGNMGFADPRYDFAFALTKNRMLVVPPGEDAAYLVAREIRQALGIPETE